MQPSHSCPQKITDSFTRTKPLDPPAPKDPNIGPSAAEKESSHTEESLSQSPPPAMSQQRVTRATVGTPADSSRITNVAEGKKLLLSTCMIPVDEDTTLEHLVKALHQENIFFLNCT